MDGFFEKMRKDNERALQTDKLNSKHLSEAVGIVNAILTDSIYNNSRTIEVGDVCFTLNFLSDRQEIDRTVSREDLEVVTNLSFTHKRKLSNILFDLYYRKPSNGKYYQYTKISALRHILKGELRLKPLLSNENDDEFVTFYHDHHLDGYEKKDQSSFGWSKEGLMREHSHSAWLQK